MKRKFRKLWRKLAKKASKNRQKAVGLGAQEPTKGNKSARKTLVLGHVLDKINESVSSMKEAIRKDSSEK